MASLALNHSGASRSPAPLASSSRVVYSDRLRRFSAPHHRRLALSLLRSSRAHLGIGYHAHSVALALGLFDARPVTARGCFHARPPQHSAAALQRLAISGANALRCFATWRLRRSALGCFDSVLFGARPLRCSVSLVVCLCNCFVRRPLWCSAALAPGALRRPCAQAPRR